MFTCDGVTSITQHESQVTFLEDIIATPLHTASHVGQSFDFYELSSFPSSLQCHVGLQNARFAVRVVPYHVLMSAMFKNSKIFNNVQQKKS